MEATKPLLGCAHVCQVVETEHGTRFCEALFETYGQGDPPRPWLFVGKHDIQQGDTIVALQHEHGIKHYKMIAQTRLEEIAYCRLSRDPRNT